jgi:3,4-dihydroxy 2-butanone 4-phosphate synthase/GTP cyclohydrolase II
VIRYSELSSEADITSKKEMKPMKFRQIGLGAQILSDVGVRKMRVMSNPRKYHALSGFGLEVVEYVT